MNISIRKVKISDAVFLTYMLNIPCNLHRLHMTSTVKQDWDEAIQFWMEDADEKDYIIMNDGIPIGLFALNGLESKDRKAYLKMAVLLPAYQNKGIGQWVITELASELRKTGYASVGLFTDLDNFRAQKCYEKCGFQRVRELEEEMQDGIIVNRLEMEKKL